MLACGIIAVLAGLILSVISHSMMTSNRAACLSNMRQIGMALSLYACDHDGCLPPTSHTTGIRYIGESWIYLLSDYLGNLDSVRVCPADESERKQYILKQKATSYVLNNLVFDDPAFNRLSNLPVPSATLSMFILSADKKKPGPAHDHTHSDGWLTWYAFLDDTEPDRHRTGVRAADRLKGSANYLYMDGHVENISAASMKKIFDKGINPAAIPANIP